MTCPICFDDMDMKQFRDEAQSTETCFKLECGHAFHTKCIVQFLTRTEHKCPSCNQHKTPEQSLEIEGVLRTLLVEVKKDPRVRYAKHEHEEFTNEYKSALNLLTIESKAWIRNRAKELKIQDHKVYYQRSINAVLNTAIEVAKELGPKFMAAMKSDRTIRQNRRYGVTIVHKVIFGKDIPFYRDWKLRHPRIWISL